MDAEPIRLDTGELTMDQVLLLLATLPLDLTFVDEDGVVRFYSEGYRIFKRTPTDIGKNVAECHSAASRSRVSQLISELATGWRDSADFVEQKDGRLVSVKYIAVRDSDGRHRGVLEIAQYLDELGGDPTGL
jgi:uncharacterized protein